MSTDEYTKILLEFNGTDGATTTVDSCETPKSLSFSSDWKLVTGVYKYGSASGKMWTQGTNDYGQVYTTNGSADFNVSSSDYGMSGWIYLDNVTPDAEWDNLYAVCGIDGVAGNMYLGITIKSGAGGKFLCHYIDDVVNVEYELSSLTTNTWYHIAVTCKDDTAYLFFDGEMVASAASDPVGNSDAFKFYAPYYMGPFHIDQVEFTKGAARWTADFTPAEYYEYVGPVTYQITVDEVADILDDVWDLREFLLDTAAIAETPSVAYVLAGSLTDSIVVRVSVIGNLTLLLQEALGISDTAASTLSFLLVDYFTIVDTHIVSWRGTQSVQSEAFLYEDIEISFAHIIAETLGVSDSVATLLSIILREFLVVTEAALASGRSSLSVADTAAVVDTTYAGWVRIISEVLGLADSNSLYNLLTLNVAESLVLQTTPTSLISLLRTVSDSITVQDSVINTGRLYSVIYDTLRLNLTVAVDGEVWECYVLNTPKFLPSIYTGFDYNSYCVFDNRAYGCKATGLYELTGTTDNGVAIKTGVQLSETTFGLPNQKRIRKAYVGASGTTPLMIMETEDGTTKTYSVDADGEVDATRALRSKRWKLSVIDFDELDFIKLIPVILAK